MKVKVWVELGSGYRETVLDIPDEEVLNLSGPHLLGLIGEHIAHFVHNSVTVGYEILPFGDPAPAIPETDQ